MDKKQNITPRFAAVQCLLDLKKEKRSAKQVLEKMLAKNSMSSRDRQLAHTLVFGVLRNRQYLDHLIISISEKPIKKIHPVVYQAISSGLFQVFCLDRIPEPAAVNESLNVLKKYGLPKRLTGFANWLLRESIRKAETLPSPVIPQKKDDILNHPKWLCERWERNYTTKKMVEICATNATVPKLALRVNELLTTPEKYLELLKKNGIESRSGRYAPGTIILENYRGRIEELPEYDKGFFNVQDQAAQLAGLLLSPLVNNGLYLDACAGLGGKTLHILERLPRVQGQLVALEPSSYRFNKLQHNLSRAGISGFIKTLQMDIESFQQKKPALFDGIFIDAPCSGTGVIRKQPDIRWSRQEKDLAKYSQQQLDILKCGAQMLKTGGLLVYATCSIEPEENQQVITTFLRGNPNYVLTPCQDHLPAACHEIINDNCLSPLPGEEMDGFFAARLMRVN